MTGRPARLVPAPRRSPPAGQRSCTTPTRSGSGRALGRGQLGHRRAGAAVGPQRHAPSRCAGQSVGDPGRPGGAGGLVRAGPRRQPKPGASPRPVLSLIADSWTAPSPIPPMVATSLTAKPGSTGHRPRVLVGPAERRRLDAAAVGCPVIQRVRDWRRVADQRLWMTVSGPIGSCPGMLGVAKGWWSVDGGGVVAGQVRSGSARRRIRAVESPRPTASPTAGASSGAVRSG